MDNVWFQSALWMVLALAAAMGSLWITISAALFEIVVGAIAGNTIGLPPTPWINYIAGVGAVVLTFLAGTDIDPNVVKKHFWSSMSIGLMGFFAPYIGCLLLARFGLGWPWPQAQIAGISLSTTSVAVVYAVMVETGYNRTELGKIILAACFINDIGTVLALGLVFANYNFYLLLFAVVTVAVVAVLPWVVPWLFKRISGKASEPEIKFLFLVLFGLGGLANLGKSEAVLPAYLVGMALAPFFLANRELQLRLRAICFAFLTPFYFLKAGSLIEANALVAGAGTHRPVPGHEDGDQVRRHPAVDSLFQIRSARGHVHDADDVHGPDFRIDLGAIRPDQPHHRPGAVHHPADRRHRQRGGAYTHRADLVPAALRAAGGGRLAFRRPSLGTRLKFRGTAI